METSELLAIIARDEDGMHQFKANVTNAKSLAQEMVAFSNSNGGMILIGVTGDRQIAGLTADDMARLNQLVSNTASQMVRPPINPQTENIAMPEGLVMVVTILSGISKPYMDNDGAVFVKSGADKRKVTAREELQRMFQSTALVHADIVPVAGTSVADLDRDYFNDFMHRVFTESLAGQEIPLPQLLANMNLMQAGVMNLAGMMLFGRQPWFRLPVYIVKAVAFPGVEIESGDYLDSQDIHGKLADIFQHSLSFILSNLHHTQGGQSFNSLGEPEIPRIVFEELVTNALIHRDYFVSASVRVLIFIDRIEIISPGHLPNNLTVANIKSGNSNIRNPVLASYATRILPYRGLGSGILRALKAWPSIEFEDDREGNQFKVTLARKTQQSYIKS